MSYAKGGGMSEISGNWKNIHDISSYANIVIWSYLGFGLNLITIYI